MKSFSYTEARDRLKYLMDQVNEDHAPLYIRRCNGEGAILMAESDQAIRLDRLRFAFPTG